MADPVSPKVTAASGAAGGSMPLAIIIVWLLGQAGIQVPPEIGAAIASLVSAIAAFAAGYFTRHVPAAVAIVTQQPGGQP